MEKRKLNRITAGFIVLVVMVLILMFSNSLRRSSHITLPEEGSFPAVAASCCLASFAGAMLSVRRSSWGSLASAMVSAAGFLLAVVAVALLCWQQITWLGRGGVLLLCGAGGGLLAGLLGGRRRKRKRRPVRRGRKA